MRRSLPDRLARGCFSGTEPPHRALHSRMPELVNETAAVGKDRKNRENECKEFAGQIKQFDLMPQLTRARKDGRVVEASE